MALTTQAEIEKRLQWDITAEPDSVVTSLIAAATAHMEAEVGRKLESATYTAELYDAENPILLANWPVSAISAVTEDGTAVASTGYMFYRDGRLFRVANGFLSRWRTRKLRSIAVTYTAGFLAGFELSHLGSICTEIVARAFRSGAASAATPAGVGLGGITSVHLEGSDEVTYTSANSGSATVGGGLTRFIFILDEERRQLAQYRAAI